MSFLWPCPDWCFPRIKNINSSLWGVPPDTALKSPFSIAGTHFGCVSGRVRLHCTACPDALRSYVFSALHHLLHHQSFSSPSSLLFCASYLRHSPSHPLPFSFYRFFPSHIFPSTSLSKEVLHIRDMSPVLLHKLCAIISIQGEHFCIGLCIFVRL